MAAASLMDIMETILQNSDDYSADIVKMEKIFGNYVKNKGLTNTNMNIVDDPKEETGKSIAENDKVQKLAFNMAWNVLVESMSRGKKENRLQALKTTMKLIKYQALLKNSEDKFYFPCHMLKGILNQLLSHNIDQSVLIAQFLKYSAFNDVLFYCWKILPSILHKQANPSQHHINNVFSFISTIPLQQNSEKKRKINPEEVKVISIFCKIEGGARFKFDIINARKWMEESWKLITNWNLQGTNLQRAILLLIDHLMPHLPNPVLLTDFLMNSMDSGGAISMVALQGVFILMQKHNLEYPQVYKKIYNLYEPELFFTNHKSRLMFLTDTFLTSTHLPESLVAAFIKKFARLALLVSSSDAVVLLQFISNLIVRHQGLKVMLNSKLPESSDLVNDPYVVEEKDPCLSRAINSSLWEVADLKNHAHPSVVAAASAALNAHHLTMEKPISELLDDTEDDLINSEFNKQYKQIYLATRTPNTGQSILSDYWQLF